MPAGERAEATFSCGNDADKPVKFEISTDGLPASWVKPAAEVVIAGPFDQANFIVLLTPPPSADIGDYPFKIRMTSGGSLVEPPGEIELFMRVLEGVAPLVEEAPPPVAEPDEQPVDVQAQPQTEPKKPRASRKKADAQPAEPVREPHVVTPEPEPEPEP
ncbi:MAG TPA: hypothetical protein VM328_05400, partial [Fimbriimonadaceae bacterium]|nr:hypothetical protein [Fimbriimonadaceae bacterium]